MGGSISWQLFLIMKFICLKQTVNVSHLIWSSDLVQNMSLSVIWSQSQESIFETHPTQHSLYPSQSRLPSVARNMPLSLSLLSLVHASASTWNSPHHQ